MASSISSFASLLFLLVATAAVASAAGAPEANTTHLHFYTSNVTTYTVAGLNQSSPSIFGDIFVYDTPLTAGPEPSSEVIGRGQGIAVGTSLTDASLLTAINFVFTSGEYNGSTLAMFGGVNGMGYGDRPIVGGSGKFRMASGYAVSEITQMTPYSVVEFNVNVTLY